MEAVNAPLASSSYGSEPLLEDEKPEFQGAIKWWDELSKGKKITEARLPEKV